MVKIWGRKDSSNVQKVLWCCDELGVAYERIDIGGSFGGNKEKPYLDRNPNGLVPTIEDGVFVLWESNSIVRYLVDRYGGDQLISTTPEGRADSSRWMQRAPCGSCDRTHPRRVTPVAASCAERLATNHHGSGYGADICGFGSYPGGKT